jgi:hypothetical protein
LPPSAFAAEAPSLFTPVTTALSCEPLTASVLVCEITPAATFWICRSLPAAPTETTPLAATGVPATAAPYCVKGPVLLGAAVTAPAPSATELAVLACVLKPRAIAFSAVDFA